MKNFKIHDKLWRESHFEYHLSERIPPSTVSRKQSLLIIGLVSVIAISAFMSGFFMNAWSISAKTRFPILLQAYNILSNHAFNEMPPAPSLEYGMIRGMLEAFGDPYSIFLEPIQHELESNNLQGNFGGIGVDLVRNEDGSIILFPFQDSPATQAGILEGDRLIAVDQLNIDASTPIESILAAIRGPVGEKVQIIIARAPDYLPTNYKVERRQFSLPSVTWHLDLNESWIGVIKVNIIADSTPQEILNSVEDLERRGATHFILDLRDNGGGILSAGIDTARLFLEEGLILQQHYRGKEIESFEVEKSGPLIDIPLVLLVNQNTASAAEIIAGALKVHQRAQMIGQPTFGKDTIQLVFDLDDGSSLHVTAAKWWVPRLEPPIGENGLQPDILILEGTPGADPIYDKAIKTLIEMKK